MACNPSFPSSLISPKVVEEGLRFLVLGTVLSSFLIPTAIVLFFFSTPRLRRQPAFIFNVIAIVVGLIQGVIIFLQSTGPMLNKPDISITSSTLVVSLYVLVPLCAESVLIFRVVAVYPPYLLSRTRCVALYGPIACLKVARVVNASYFIHSLLEGPHAQGPLSLAEYVWHLPNGKVEWFLQLVDDTYVSGLFLFRIHTGTCGFVGHPLLRSALSPGSSRYFERLKTLFWISVSNFVFPVLLNVVQLVFILRDADFVRGTLVLMVNNYVTIFGVILATIWASGSEAGEHASTTWTPTDRNSRTSFKFSGVGEVSTGTPRGRPRSAPPTRRREIISVENVVKYSPFAIV